MDLVRLAAKKSPDILHAHLGQALVMGAIRKVMKPNVGLIYSQHILYPSSSKSSSPFGLFRQAVVRWSYGRADRIVAVSKAVADAMAARGERFPVSQIYNGVPARTGAVRAPTGGRLKVIGISRLQTEKRPHDYLDVAKILDDERIDIVVYGTGVLETSLRAAAAASTSRTKVTFAGFRTDIERALAEADLFMHFGEEEACPLAVLEAIMWGLPILTIRVGGNTELVTGVGRLFDVGDARGMAAELRRLADHPETLAEMSRAAIAASPRFSLERMVGEIEALYEEIATSVR